MASQAPILIVGAGQAGVQIAESLRQEGYADDLLLIGNESHPPYQRPPLSKKWLLEPGAHSALSLRGADAPRLATVLASGGAGGAEDLHRGALAEDTRPGPRRPAPGRAPARPAAALNGSSTRRETAVVVGPSKASYFESSSSRAMRAGLRTRCACPVRDSL